jgi:hypothetical protein
LTVHSGAPLAKGWHTLAHPSLTQTTVKRVRATLLPAHRPKAIRARTSQLTVSFRDESCYGAHGECRPNCLGRNVRSRCRREAPDAPLG